MNTYQQGNPMNLKEYADAILKSIREDQARSLPRIAEELEKYNGNESVFLQHELLGFIESMRNAAQFPKDEFRERIDRHCKIFAKHKLHEIRCRAKLLLASYLLQTYNSFPECLEVIHEVEHIHQKHLGNNSKTLFEALFIKGSLYYNQANYEESSKALLQAQSLSIYATISPDYHFKSNINLCRNYILINDYQKALKHFELAEKSWELYKNDFDKPALYIRKSDMQRINNDWEGARDTLIECVEFAKGTPFKMRIAESFKELGEFYCRIDNPIKDLALSLDAFEKARTIAKEINIPRLEGAILHSMRMACVNNEEWKLFTEYWIQYEEIAASVNFEAVSVYIKQLELASLAEKERMIQQGKPTYSQAMIEEVVELREKNDSLKKKNIELERVISDIESLIEKKSQNGNGTFLEQLHQMVQKSKSGYASVEECLLECDKLHPAFGKSLLNTIPTITAMEMKIAKLIRLGMTSQSMATMCGITIKSIENHRMRLRKKCNLDSSQSLASFIISLK